jgi:hypothetical protein
LIADAHSCLPNAVDYLIARGAGADAPSPAPRRIYCWTVAALTPRIFANPASLSRCA